MSKRKSEDGFSVRYSARWLPKAGSSEAEYEDAFARSADGVRPFRAAVADGATESAFAGVWARVLAEGAVVEDGADEKTLGAQLPAWQAQWAATIESRAEALPWYAAAKAEEGAFAALLGLSLEEDGHWQAAAVGDCCLFHLRGADVLTAWPVETPEAFGNRPALLPSRTGHAVPPVETRTGRFATGDTFLLATDALAAWTMRAGPDEARAAAEDAEAFAGTVERAREDGTLRNDDVTLLVLETTMRNVAVQ